MNPLPFIVTVFPVVAEIGENEVIAGGVKYVKPAKEAFPPAVITVTLPDAPLPTTADI